MKINLQNIPFFIFLKIIKDCQISEYNNVILINKYFNKEYSIKNILATSNNFIICKLQNKLISAKLIDDVIKNIVIKISKN